MRRLNKKTKTPKGGSGLATLGKVPDTAPETSGQTFTKTDPVPYVAFYSPRSSRATAVSEALGGGLVNGHPYLTVPEVTERDADGNATALTNTYLDLAGVPFTILDHFGYFVKNEAGSYRAEKVYTDKPTGDYRANGVRQAAQCLMLHVFDDGTVIASKTELLGPKEPAARDHVKAQVEAKSPTFAKKHGDLVAKAPPALRVFSVFNMKPSGPKARYPYVSAYAEASPLTADIWAALIAWEGDEAAQEQFEETKTSFEGWVAYLKTLT